MCGRQKTIIIFTEDRVLTLLVVKEQFKQVVKNYFMHTSRSYLATIGIRTGLGIARSLPARTWQLFLSC